MKKAAVIFCALVGCSAHTPSAGDAAAKKHEIVAGFGDPSRTCQSAHEVAEAYASDGNRSEAERWNKHAEGACTMARLLATGP